MKEVNRQLEHAGLKLSGLPSAIIDATIIPSAARSNLEEVLDVNESESTPK